MSQKKEQDTLTGLSNLYTLFSKQADTAVPGSVAQEFFADNAKVLSRAVLAVAEKEEAAVPAAKSESIFNEKLADAAILWNETLESSSLAKAAGAPAPKTRGQNLG